MKNRLMKLIEREEAYLAEQEVGTEEYNASWVRATNLEKQLADLEESEKSKADSRKEQKIKVGVDIGKFILGGVIIPAGGTLLLLAHEKDSPILGILKEYSKLILPKRM